MSKEIKTRQVHKDVKALDKTMTGMERVKRAYVRTKETVENAQPQEKRYASPTEYAEEKTEQGADRAAHEAAHQARKQGGRLVDKAKEKHRISKETKETREAVREGRNPTHGEPSTSPPAFRPVRQGRALPAERADDKKGAGAGRKTGGAEESRRAESHVLYDLIIPNIDYDIKMRFVSVEYLDELLERVSKACASAGNKGREILNLAMKEAVIESYIDVNPVPETKPYKRKKPHIVILSREKIKILLQAASKDNWYLEILLGLFCGLRKGEIYGLKFSDFDLENRSVKISRQIVANPIIKEGSRIEENVSIERDPKTPNSFRVLRVPEVIITELEKRRCLIEIYKEKMQENFIDNDYISCQANGKVHSLSAINIALKKLCVRNGLPAITVHGLRHMFATILVEQGVPLAKISGLLGHSSVNTTFEYYCDVMDEKEKIIAFMNDTFTPEGREGTG